MAEPIKNIQPICPYCGALATDEQKQEVINIYKEDPNEPAFINCSGCGESFECDLMEDSEQLGDELDIMYWTYRTDNLESKIQSPY